MAQYYYLGTAIPELEIGKKPEISMASFSELLKDLLKKEDMEVIRHIRTYFDIENIRAFWLGHKIDGSGNFDEVELEDSLLTKTGLPSFVFDYLEKYQTKEARIKHFSKLVVDYFKDETGVKDGFLRYWLDFERKVRLVLVALRAKKWGINLLNELQFENPDDPFVSELIAQKDVPTILPPEGFDELKSIYDTYQDKPLELHKAILEFRFKKIGAYSEFNVFSSDRIFAYLIQLRLVERWLELNEEEGKMMINNIVQGAT